MPCNCNAGSLLCVRASALHTAKACHCYSTACQPCRVRYPGKYMTPLAIAQALGGAQFAIARQQAYVCANTITCKAHINLETKTSPTQLEEVAFGLVFAALTPSKHDTARARLNWMGSLSAWGSMPQIHQNTKQHEPDTIGGGRPCV